MTKKLWQIINRCRKWANFSATCNVRYNKLFLKANTLIKLEPRLKKNTKKHAGTIELVTGSLTLITPNI